MGKDFLESIQKQYEAKPSKIVLPDTGNDLDLEIKELMASIEDGPIKDGAMDVIDRFKNHPDKQKHIIDTMKSGEDKTNSPFLRSKYVDMPIVNPFAKPSRRLGYGKPKDFREDPFSWFAHKYGTTMMMLKCATFPLNIETSSDLIARDDYLKAIPNGSKVRIYQQFPDGLEYEGIKDYWRIHPKTANFPSNKRLAGAAKKLKDHGINVELIPNEEK